jgi:diguanylate cyclase (GGDEF)-like protein
MMPLDLRSIVIMSGVLGLLISMVFLFLRVSYPKSIKGLGFWAAAPALEFGSALMFGLRGQIPDVLSILCANLALLTGVAFVYFGIQRFFNQAPSFRRVMSLIAALAPFLVWFTVVNPSFNARVLLVTAVWLVVQYMMVMLIWRLGRPAFATRFTLVVLLSHAGVLLLRFGAALFPPDEGLFEPSRIQTLYIGMNILVLLAQGFGIILMASDRLHEEFEHAANHDSLTNVLMRRAVIDLCEQELERCRRHGHKMVLLMLDIDHFKAINDTYGHQTGDRVLIDFVNRIAPLLRRSDQFGRFGGEEFVVLLPETSQEEALVVAERIRTHVELPVKDMPSVTVSIGLTSNRPDESKIDGLLARADKALYKAKAAGRNRVEAV